MKSASAEQDCAHSAIGVDLVMVELFMLTLLWTGGFLVVLMADVELLLLIDGVLNKFLIGGYCNLNFFLSLSW